MHNTSDTLVFLAMWSIWKMKTMSCSVGEKFQHFKNIYIFTQFVCNEQEVTQGQFLSKLKLVWNQFSSFYTGCKRTQFAILFLPIAGWGWTDGFMPFPRALGWSEMQTALFRFLILLLFNSLSTFVGYLMQKPSLSKNSSGPI